MLGNFDLAKVANPGTAVVGGIGIEQLVPRARVREGQAVVLMRHTSEVHSNHKRLASSVVPDIRKGIAC